MNHTPTQTLKHSNTQTPIKIFTLVFLAAVATFAGCKSIEVEKRSQTLAFDKNGETVRTAAGEPVILDGGWKVDYFQHWNTQKFDSLTAKAGQAELAINNYESSADTNLVALVDVSAKGAALLAERVAAAVASFGGSTTAEALSAAIEKYVRAGGSTAKAAVKCEDGKCTITDGTVSECIDCTAK